MALVTPIAAILAYFVLGEALSLLQIGGGVLVLIGVVASILFAQGGKQKTDTVRGSYALMVAFGVSAAAFGAVGLVALKPILMDATDPLAATAVRTTGATAIMVTIALWPAKAFAPASRRTGRLVLSTILPGILGYVVAVGLQLYALQSFNTAVASVLGSAAPALILPMIWITTGKRPPALAWVGAALVMAGIAVMVLE